MKNKIIGRPVKLREISFDELYEDFSRDWQYRAQRLQARRWHMLRHKFINGEAKKKQPARFIASSIRS